MLRTELTKAIPKNRMCRIDEDKRQFGRESIAKKVIEKVSIMPIPTAAEIKLEYKSVDPDMSVCKACNETIYSVQKVLVLKVDDEVIETNLKLCNECFIG